MTADEITAFIFAAGLGTRLKPLTDTMPKAMVPIAGKPLISHIISTLEEQGVKQFVVNVHHFAEQIRSYLASRPDAGKFTISDETDLLRETGGAIKYAFSKLGDKTFLVHNVDIISNFKLSEMLKTHKSDSLATLLVSERKTQRYLLFDNDMKLVGWTNTATGEIKSPHTIKDIDSLQKLAFSGIHLINPTIHQLLQPYPDKFSIIDFYIQQCAKYDIYGYVQPDLRLIDVGKTDTLSTAEKILRTL